MSEYLAYYTPTQRLAQSANMASILPISDLWQIKEELPFFERLGKCGVELALKIPAIRNVVCEQVARDFTGYTYLGGGFQQLVLRNDQKVLKVLMDHRGLEGPLESKAQQLQVDSDTCRRYLGAFWTNTNYEVVRQRRGDGRIIIAHQPHIKARKSFQSSRDISKDPFVSTRDKHEFVDRTESLHADTGLYPDLIGEHNVVHVVDSNNARLQVLDTVPVSGVVQELTVDGVKVSAMISSGLEVIRGG